MNITKAIVIENSCATLLARIRAEDGSYPVQADISTVTCKVFDLDTSTEISPAPTFTAASTVFDTLQTSDPRWTVDATGFNFAAKLAGSNFPEGDTTYQVEIKITPVSGNAFYVVYDLDTFNLLSE
jgi:hypothetical protein